ncbi:EAL domain-containing protein [Sulfurimonas sp. NWX367]
MFGFFEYTVSKSKEAILTSYLNKAKEESYMFKTLIDEFPANKKEDALQKGIFQLSLQSNIKYIMLVSADERILYASRKQDIGKKLQEVFSAKRLQHYEKEIKNFYDFSIHLLGQSIDVTIRIDDYGYLLMLYDLHTLILQKEKEIFQELLAVFFFLLFIIILLFYLYYKHFLIKLHKIYDITSTFNRKQSRVKSLYIDDLLEQITNIAKESEIIARVIEYSNDAILITDAKKNIIFVNPAFERISQFTRDEVIGKKPEEIIKSNLMSDEYYADMWYKIHTFGNFQGKIIDRRKDGTDYVVWQKIWALKEPKTGSITNYVAMSQDITDLIAKQKEVEQLAYYDALTGLANRNYFIRILNKLIKKRKKEHFALFFADIDNFKEINETIGYHAGDIVIQKFAQYLQDTLREEDIIARLGGDEFAILAYDITKPEDALEIGCKINDFSKQELFIDKHIINVSVSNGIALYPGDGSNTKELLAAVDIALFRSKKEGKNRCTIFQARMQEEAVKKMLIRHELKTALKNNEFELYYQPKFTVDGRSIAGFEALIRWNHPKKGFIRPDHFIPVAEESEIIIDITQWIFREINTVCKELNQICNKFTIAVNISAQHFKEHNLLEHIQTYIDKQWIDGGHIELEITESAIMNNIQEAVQQLTQIQSLGIDISLDDYGTGYSSLAYLKNLPINKVKIDKSFIDEICTNRKDYIIVKSTIALAENLGMCTIVEGVEDKEQQQLVQEFGATYIQGYIFSKPLKKKDAVQLLQLTLQ